ncbi:AcrR family transcriptional regulator [Salirhabdus euzebyi]|uniref:AcrR family transcriptional regulator n=1 Tax=Salirhabdus euzebyi TaxID=394506 RepID=A0A841Q936_9BACI|nr:TetR/AcrR family transcriptional regulator [Salirhabdus euzebyi]MBB6454824.1 AcrR family transcriptional regulator [Salirhabdus euzebyi]
MSPKVSKEHLKQRRAKILEAAKEVFIKQGYEHTTMKHVMEAANVSRGGLYQYFSNKEDLYEAILENNLSNEVTENQDSLENEVDSYWDLLMTRIFGDDMDPDDNMDPLAPSNLEFFITGRNDERRRMYGKARYQDGYKLYADVIKAGQQNGEFSLKYDSDIIARTIVSFIDGLAVEHAILPLEILKMKEQSELFVEYLKLALEVK